MAVTPSAHPGGIAPTTEYPFGLGINSTSPGAKDGYAFNKDYTNDYIGFFTALLSRAGLVPSGLPDTLLEGQYEQGFGELIHQAPLRVDVVIDVDTDHDISCPLGVSVSENSRGFIAQTSALIKQIDAAFAVGDAAGGMFDAGGVQANTWYVVARIRRDSDGIVDVGYDSSVSLANIPAGWTAFAIVAAVLTDGASNISRLVRRGDIVRTKISVSGTYLPPPIAESLDFDATGAGGGGGGVDGQGGNTAANGTSGAAGGTAIKRTNIIEASYAIIIGALGVGGVAGNNDGSAGGNTTVVSVDVNLTANGGAGGVGAIGSSGNVINTGSLGGTASGGDTNLDGGPGGPRTTNLGELSDISESGSSYLGPGPLVRNIASAAGNNSVNAGSGGGGAGALDTTNNFAGGDGAVGEVNIKERC